MTFKFYILYFILLLQFLFWILHILMLVDPANKGRFVATEGKNINY